MPASCPRYPLPHHPAPCPARDQDSHITLWRGPNNRHQGQGSELLLQALPVSLSCTSGMPKSCVRSIVTKQIQPSLYVRTAGRTLGLNSGSELGTSHSSCSCSTARAHLKVVEMNLPAHFCNTGLTLSSRMTGRTPKKGSVAEPGRQGQAPGRGVIMAAPVSVCHHVSTIGHRPSPTNCAPQDKLQALKTTLHFVCPNPEELRRIRLQRAIHPPVKSGNDSMRIFTVKR